MAAPRLSDEKCREALDALAKADGNMTHAAKALGLGRSTFEGRVRTAKQRLEPEDKDEQKLVLPVTMSGDIPAEEIVEYLKKKHAKKKQARDANKWAQIKVNHKKPFGIAIMGDPHVDSGGCNWTLLSRDIDLIKNTEGLYCGNIGDTTDNWVGRLSALYAHNPTTRTDAINLAEWLITELKEKWVFILRGNHDMWTASRKDDPLTWFQKGGAPVMDWSYRFELTFPKGPPYRIHAAHSFKGNSYLNSTHGMQRRNRESEGEADLYAQGHHHEWALRQEENPHNGRVHWYVKARGYKDIDTFAEVHGFGSQEHGASVTIILDPMEENPVRRAHCFADLEEAVSYLEWLRNGR